MKKILLALMLCLFTTQMAFATATGIKNYSSTPANNNASPPNGAPESWAPSQVNDVMRQVMAEVRRWYEDPAWIDYGYTYVYNSTTSFKVAGTDVRGNFVVGRRVRAVGATTGTIYGTIATSTYSTDTTVTVTWDSGSLASETLAISIGIPTLGSPIPAGAVSGIATTTDATISTSDVTTNNVTSTKHGFAPKSPADATKFLNGAATPDYVVVKDSDLSTTDITTNDVTSSKHGFAPKADGNSAHFLNGAGGYTAPSIAQPVKAWLTYNIASSTLLASSGVASVTKNSTGNITITFSSTQNANYAVTGSTDSGANAILEVISAGTTTLQVQFHVTNTGSNYDASFASVVVIGS